MLSQLAHLLDRISRNVAPCRRAQSRFLGLGPTERSEFASESLIQLLVHVRRRHRQDVVVRQVEQLGKGQLAESDSMSESPAVEDVPPFGVAVVSAIDPSDETDDGVVGRRPSSSSR